jgi:TetR/AcrR family transcriptional repressor of lmrAB and yxaGH operons
VPRPDRHREPLVAAAATSLRQRGYAATSVGEVLRQADATNGSLYHHFPGGKADLADAALTAAGAAVDRALATALERSPTPAAAVRGWIDALIAGLRGDPRDGCPIATPAVELSATNERLRATAAAAFARWTRTLADGLGGDEAALRTARVVLAAIEGALLLDRIARTTDNLEAVRDGVPDLLGKTRASGARATPSPRRGGA